MVTPEFVAIGWKYLRRYFKLEELYIAERRNRLPAKAVKNDWRSHFSGGAFLAVVKPPAPGHRNRAMRMPLASHPWRVQFRVAARQNRRRDRLVPTKAHL
jgi:hypothetical protein